jgi:hypothetical protein
MQGSSNNVQDFSGPEYAMIFLFSLYLPHVGLHSSGVQMPSSNEIIPLNSRDNIRSSKLYTLYQETERVFPLAFQVV